MNKIQMNEETEIRTLIPNYPVSNFESAKRRILLLESLCFQLKTSEDLAKLELKKAQTALKKIKTREKQIHEHITNLENKILDKITLLIVQIISDDIIIFLIINIFFFSL